MQLYALLFRIIHTENGADLFDACGCKEWLVIKLISLHLAYNGYMLTCLDALNPVNFLVWKHFSKVGGTCTVRDADNYICFITVSCFLGCHLKDSAEEDGTVFNCRNICKGAWLGDLKILAVYKLGFRKIIGSCAHFISCFTDLGVDARGRGNTCLGIKIIMWIGGSCLLLALFCSYLTLTEEVLTLTRLCFLKDLNAALLDFLAALCFSSA